jgi:hypothetical protein
MQAALHKKTGWPDWANFRPLGNCPPWEFLEIIKVAHIFWPHFTTMKVMHQFGQKTVLGYILGKFFTTSSGHPASSPEYVTCATELWHINANFSLGVSTKARQLLTSLSNTPCQGDQIGRIFANRVIVSLAVCIFNLQKEPNILGNFSPRYYFWQNKVWATFWANS